MPPLRTLLLPLLIAFIGGALPSAQGATTLAAHGLFQNHMVLQQGQPVPVWGTGPDGEVVTVTINGKSATATVSGGKWKAMLDPMNYGGPYVMTIRSVSKTITLSDVYVGEVWLCSGQSNMEYWLPPAQAPTVDHPLIRTVNIRRTAGRILDPRSEIEPTPWRVSTRAETAGYFTAVGYYFALTLSASLNVAVGIINSSYGGTHIETWTSRAMQEAVPELQPVLPYWEPYDPSLHHPADLYNGMIHPLAPFAIKGVCWYQGESRMDHGVPYRDQLPALIQDWRNLWQANDLPFNIVQLPSYGSPPQTIPDSSTGGWKAVQEAQLLAVRHMNNVGLAVTLDCADPTNPDQIHPPNKQPVGHRLALWTLANTYGRSLSFSGPLYKSMRIEGNHIRLTFDHADGMRAANGGALTGFAICGADMNFVWGDATIEGDEIVVSSPLVPAPTVVRYAWSNISPLFSLFNQDGLPASPFRTDCPTGIIADLPNGETTPATFADWRSANFGADAGNDAISGPAADPDSCGLTNFARYAFALSARGPVANPITVGTASSSGANYLTLTFPRRTAATGLNYILESSTDLATWIAVPGRTYTPGTGPITAVDSVALDAAPRHFLRVRVTQQ